MNASKVQRRTGNLIACVLLGVFYVVDFIQANESYEVVVNPGVSEQAISRDTLRIIFGMRLQVWPEGAPIKVFILPDDHPAHVNFSKETLNVFPYQLRAAWDRLTFSGTGQAPIEVNSEEEMRTRVAATPGAIGYLRGAMINDQVRVLQIK